MLSLAAWPLGQSARSNVNSGFANQRLEPLHPREKSARRDRRQKQLAVVAPTGYLTFRVLDVIAAETGENWPVIPAFIGMVLAAGGALGLVWSMAWRFGDEQPA